MTTKQNKKPSGYIIYRGASLLDGKPIVVVAITKSGNAKTGNMVQTYILADNGKSPVESAKSLEDVSVCGDCKHRRGTGGSCYVNLGQGARSVMDGVMRGIYPEVYGLDRAADACVDRKVRLGTYGDPAAVPAYVWKGLLTGSNFGEAAGHTGYTHQWQTGKADHVKQWCMASADTMQEMALAKLNGWRTFRVRSEDDSHVYSKEMACPASAEQGKRLTCEDCMACSGGIDSKKASVTIIVHGSLKNRFNNSLGV